MKTGSCSVKSLGPLSEADLRRMPAQEESSARKARFHIPARTPVMVLKTGSNLWQHHTTGVAIGLHGDEYYLGAFVLLRYRGYWIMVQTSDVSGPLSDPGRRYSPRRR